MKPINEAAVTFLSRSANEGFCPHGGGLLRGPTGPHPGRGERHQDRRQRGGDQRHCPRYPDRLGKIVMEAALPGGQ